MGATTPRDPDRRSGAVPDLIVASRNRDKVATIDRLVDGLARVRPVPENLADAAGDEDGPTLAENAATKARRVSAALPGAIVVASDGGLLVPALGPAWDPLRTRRFAGGRATDRQRAKALLVLAAGLSGEDRRIGWREALAVARDGLAIGIWTAEGTPGLLAADDDPRPGSLDGGFWVATLWVCPEADGRRLIDLSAAERADRVDHWARLGVELRRFLAPLSTLPPVGAR